METPASGTLHNAELLALFSDPVALFNRDAVLAVANPRFEQAFASIGQFVSPGTSWELFLAEAERRGALPPDSCRDLRLIEERLLDQPGTASVIEAVLGDSRRSTIELTALSDGGFAIRIHMGAAPGNEDRDIEQVMATVLEACPTSLTMARIGDGQILYRSPAATELLGKGRNSHDHFVHRDVRADFVTALLPDARVDDMRITGRRSDGSEFPASISARLIDYRGEDVMVYSILDLSDEIAMQAELVRQKDRIFQSEKMSALGELLAGIAHELNNPLSIVVGNAHILREEDLAPEILRRVGKVSDAAERCVRIVRTFLSMARERPLDLVAVSPTVVADTAMESFRAGEYGRAVEFLADVPEDLPNVLIDETQIVQVFSNLFINASQAMTEAGIGDTITLSVRASEDRRSLVFHIEDNGPGVPADIADRIFDPLFTTKSAGKGTGVGLALCNRIVASHGGTISLAASGGGGAAFTLELPLAPESVVET